MAGLVKERFKKALARFGWRLQKLPPNPIPYWETDETFNGIFGAASGRTLLDPARCYVLFQLAQQALSVEGDMAEVGVYRGGTAKLMATVALGSGKEVHLFDTFSGMPGTDPDKDLHNKGDFSDTSLEDVSEFLSDCPNSVIH